MAKKSGFYHVRVFVHSCFTTSCCVVPRSDCQAAAVVAPHRMSRDEETKAGRHLPLRGPPARLPDVCETSLHYPEAGKVPTTSSPQVRFSTHERQ